jgi:glutaredoxin
MPAPTLLFTAPGCPHCPGMKAALTVLQQEGAIATLEIVDATLEVERARQLDVKSVPWLRIGRFEFEGQMSLGDLRAWAERVAQPEGMKRYFFEMLQRGQRVKVERLIREDGQRSLALAELLADPEASMAVRIGIGAVLEELQGSGMTAAMAPKLGEILRDPEPRNRADAAHFLSLVGGAQAARLLRDCLDDPDAAVREIAYDALSNAAP